jgi:hypothetical protein
MEPIHIPCTIPCNEGGRTQFGEVLITYAIASQIVALSGVHFEITPEIQSQILAPLVARLDALERDCHRHNYKGVAINTVEQAPVDAGPAELGDPKAIDQYICPQCGTSECVWSNNLDPVMRCHRGGCSRQEVMPATPPAPVDAGPADALMSLHDSLRTATPPADDAIDADRVEWVVNDSGELGVKIGNQFFFMYKGHSLVYDSAKHDDGSQMRWRLIGKREFGECCHPYRMNGLSAQQYFGGIGAGGDWHDLPATVDDRSP